MRFASQAKAAASTWSAARPRASVLSTLRGSEPGGQALDEGPVVHPAAAQVHLVRFRTVCLDGIRDGRGGELAQGPLHVGRGNRPPAHRAELPIDPPFVEVAAPGALRSRLGEVRIGLHPLEKRLVHGASRRKAAVLVEGRVEVAPGPRIEQPVRGAAVEAERVSRRRPGGSEQRDVRDPAEVDDCPPERTGET